MNTFGKTVVWLTTLFYLALIPGITTADRPSGVNGVYIPPTQFSSRSLKKFVHYAQYTGMNAVVLHMKDPLGRLYWQSENRIAVDIGAVTGKHNLAATLNYLKKNQIRTIAKVDVFIDKKLAENVTASGLRNSETGLLWADYSGLFWTNPYDICVWEYNIDLCKELAMAGFDEIQFDYIRFPSDGPLHLLEFPVKPDDITMAESIGRFLATAYKELKPIGVDISVDVFGLTAWKKTDFGVGQIVEKIAPHVDIICPMFYPSHFPEGFMGLSKPADHPGKIMYRSITALKKRTDRKIRPWIQGFWYPPNKIRQQLNAVRRAGLSDWMVWNSAGNYGATYLAFINDLSRIIPVPQFYPSLDELTKNPPLFVRGDKIVVNFSDYQRGVTVLSLERPETNRTGKYSTPVSVIYSMDEAILDQILIKNQIHFERDADKYVKSLMVAQLLCRHTGMMPNRIRPRPIYIDWKGEARFSLSQTGAFELKGLKFSY